MVQLLGAVRTSDTLAQRRESRLHQIDGAPEAAAGHHAFQRGALAHDLSSVTFGVVGVAVNRREGRRTSDPRTSQYPFTRCICARRPPCADSPQPRKQVVHMDGLACPCARQIEMARRGGDGGSLRPADITGLCACAHFKVNCFGSIGLSPCALHRCQFGEQPKVPFTLR